MDKNRRPQKLKWAQVSCQLRSYRSEEIYPTPPRQRPALANTILAAGAQRLAQQPIFSSPCLCCPAGEGRKISPLYSAERFPYQRYSPRPGQPALRADCGGRTASYPADVGWLAALVVVLVLSLPVPQLFAEQNPAQSPVLLQVPLKALPLETILPLPKGSLAEKPTLDSAWELIPIKRLPIEQSQSLQTFRRASQEDHAPTFVQCVAGLHADGQPDQNRPQLAVQIVSAADSASSQTSKSSKTSFSPRDTSSGLRVYQLQKPQRAPSVAFEWKQSSAVSLGLWEGQTPVLVYNYGPITNPSVPATDHRRTRACYVHPVYGLGGEVLTEDFPKDHYHHHGLFWAWPHIVIEGKEHDLWAGATIRQEFVRWLARQTGPVCAVLGVENGWYVGAKKVMVERIWFWVYRTVPGHHRSIDIALFLEPTDQPVTLWGAPEKSYGGLTVRFAPSSRSETEITVPSGRTTEDLLNTPLKWADFTSKMVGSQFRSGAAIMIHPRHPDYPPTWLTRHYGAMCVGWPGVRPKTLQPHQPLRLQYRLWIHPGPVCLESLTAAYEAFCAGVEEVQWAESY
ncbi:MAG: PmoA family protein [Thermoguttaceae bacterium]|nr:PmoA family protein [Thermoguttaceae bacterium]MDW8039354.1 DUF6807 family protein [Thermoguttaceae bacterium]